MGLRRNKNIAVMDPPPFDVETERDKRRERVLAADRALSISIEALKVFQGDHFSVNASGQLVPRVHTDAVSNETLDSEHQRLVREISEAHTAFQKALKSWNEL